MLDIVFLGPNKIRYALFLNKDLLVCFQLFKYAFTFLSECFFQVNLLNSAYSRRANFLEYLPFHSHDFTKLYLISEVIQGNKLVKNCYLRHKVPDMRGWHTSRDQS